VDALGIPLRSSVLGTLPLAWGYGLNSTLLLAALLRSELLLLDRFDHRSVLQVFATWRPWFWPATSFMVDLLARCPLDGPAPAGPRSCVVGGDRLSESTAALFQDRFGTVLRPTYGAAESGLITVNTAPASEVRSDSVGPPLRGVEIRIGEDPQSPVEPTMPGRIWFKSALALTGYGFPPDVTPPREKDGWIATADLGTLNRRGELTVIGRVDDAFKTTSGHLVNPKHIEEALKRCTGVTAAAVVGLPRQNGALIGALIEGVSSPDLAAVRAEVAPLLPGWSQPDPVLATQNLPRLANGKIDYRQCAAILSQSTADA
jgi:long-chain acyl-CoA synthetase